MKDFNGVILQKGNGKPFMQGNTSLNQECTILYRGKKSLTNYCKCGKPFAESIMENGIILDGIVCSNCEKETAHIVSIVKNKC